MKSTLLEQYIRLLIESNDGFYKPNGRRTTLRAQNLTDLGLAINWARLNNAIWNAGSYTKTPEGLHEVVVTHPVSKNDFKTMIMSRFGDFINVS